MKNTLATSENWKSVLKNIETQRQKLIETFDDKIVYLGTCERGDGCASLIYFIKSSNLTQHELRFFDAIGKYCDVYDENYVTIFKKDILPEPEKAFGYALSLAYRLIPVEITNEGIKKLQITQNTIEALKVMNLKTEMDDAVDLMETIEQLCNQLKENED